MRKPRVIPDEDHEVVYERVAAVDVAKASGVVCMRLPDPARPGRYANQIWDNVPAMRAQIAELGRELLRCQVQMVTLESTSDYWRIWYYVLESIGLAVQLLWQFERMVIPVLGSLEDLATYAVLAAIVASPFRMLQFGVMFTLLPSLRSATDAASAKTILRREVGTAVAVALVSIVVIALVAPFILHHLLGGKYVIGRDLILAAVLVGLLRVWAGFSTTVVSALGSVQRIAQISGLGWLSLGVALAGAWLGSRYGLLGVILGTGAGWGVLVTAGTYLAVRSFRSRFADASA